MVTSTLFYFTGLISSFLCISQDFKMQFMQDQFVSSMDLYDALEHAF